jgi:di/tricarboxylate transporter
MARTVQQRARHQGGYRFGGYPKVGLPLMLIFLTLSLVLVPVIGPL